MDRAKMDRDAMERLGEELEFAINSGIESLDEDRHVAVSVHEDADTGARAWHFADAHDHKVARTPAEAGRVAREWVRESNGDD